MNEGNYLESNDFTPDQKQEIEEGLLAGLDVSIYAKPEFLAIQMLQIRLGLERKLPVERYATTDYDWFQMEEIRLGLEHNVDVSKYAMPSISFDVMRQIREGLESGIDLSVGRSFPAGVLKQFRIAACENIDIRKYIREGYEEEQLKHIRTALEKKLDIDSYIKPYQRGAFIRELVLGLEQNLDISEYATSQMSWQQMREIRIGLEKRLDVTIYENPLYSWQQMREIRLGLEDNLPVKDYASFMYTAKEMRKRRLRLHEEALKKTKHAGKEKEEYDNFVLMVSADRMQAYVMVFENGAKIARKQVIKALEEKNILIGIDYQAIEDLETKGANDLMVTVARGIEASKGADGYYEYMFDTQLKAKPKILANGSVDYNNIKWFELVKNEQIIAYYHPAENGKNGSTVTGEEIPGIKGKEQPPVTGFGFKLLSDRRTYVAATDGKVELRDGKLEVTNILVLDNVSKVTGNVYFNGSVYVRGEVGDGVEIKAVKDIIVDGFTGAAVLEAGGDIMLKKGNNPGGRGYIKAGNDVMGSFFENARIIAGRNMKANYCLNSEVYADKEIEISGDVGMLAGGNTYAGEIVRSHYIGNEAGIPTSIKAGKEEQYMKAKKALEERDMSVNRELMLLNNAHEDIQRRYPPEMRNNNPLYIKIENAIYTKEHELKEIQRQKEELKEYEGKLKIAKVVVKGTIYQGVKVDVNGALWRSKRTSNITIRKKDGAISMYRNI